MGGRQKKNSPCFLANIFLKLVITSLDKIIIGAPFKVIFTMSLFFGIIGISKLNISSNIPTRVT